jgi:MFS family permease
MPTRPASRAAEGGIPPIARGINRVPSWFAGEVGRTRAAVVAFFVLAGFSFSAWAVRIPDIRRELGLDEATLGLVLLGLAAGSISSMTASGWAIARFGSRRITTVAGLLSCAALALPPLASSALLLFGALFIYGAAYGMLDVAMNSQAVVVEQGWGRPIMSSFHAMFSTGALVGSFVAGFIAGRDISPETHLLGTGLVLAAAALVASRWLVPTARNERPAAIVSENAVNPQPPTAAVAPSVSRK